MHRIALVLACLASRSNGRRVQVTSERLQNNPPAEREDRQALAELLFTRRATAAFSPSSPAVHLPMGRGSAAPSPAALSHAPSRLYPHAAAMREDDDGENERGDVIAALGKGDLIEVARALGIPAAVSREMSLSELRTAVREQRYNRGPNRWSPTAGRNMPGSSQSSFRGAPARGLPYDDDDYAIRQPTPTAKSSKKNFWGLPEGLAISLSNSGIVDLNDMQKAAIETALDGKDLVVHGETGSGKTLCFVLPILARHSWHDMGLQAIVITPTLELASQVAHVFNLLRPETATAMTLGMEELPPTPILIGPPRMLNKWVKGHRPVLSDSKLENLRFVVVDEADAVLKPLTRYASRQKKMKRANCIPEGEEFVAYLDERRGKSLQVIAASATVNRPLARLINTIGERECTVIRGNSNGQIFDDELSFTPKRRQVGLPAAVSVTVVTTEQDNFLAAVHDVLETEKARMPLIFIPAGRSLPAEVKLFRNTGLNAISIDEAIAEKEHERSLAAPAAGSADGSDRFFVATPSGCRGLDVHNIDLVIIMGTPATADAFLHMAGRTGRQGAKGRVAIITTRRDADAQLPLLSSHIGVDFGADRRDLQSSSQPLVDLWKAHSRRYNTEEKTEDFYVKMERPRKYELREIQDKREKAAKEAARIKQQALGLKVLKKKDLSRKARRRQKKAKAIAARRVGTLF